MLPFGDFRAYPALKGPPWLTFASPVDRFTAELTHLESTLIQMRASVDSKPLTETLSPLDATLTKNMGGGSLWLTKHPNEDAYPGRARRVEESLCKWWEGFSYFLISLPPYFLTSSSHDRQRNVTGPSIGCTIGPPVRRDSIRLAFSAKYHFAGRSASSISINRGLCFNPSACWIIVS